LDCASPLALFLQHVLHANKFMDAKRITLAILACLAISPGGALAVSPNSTDAARVVLSFDDGWRFLKADAPGAEQSGFDDTKWKPVNVPHDWSIAGPFAETNKTGGAGAFLPSGVAWYRKTFSLPSEDLDRRVFVEFDGVMANSDVWINGFHLGHRPNGYVSFRYELTGTVLNFGRGAANVLAVCADTSAQPASRWYAGAGIYRHVRLVVTDPVHIAENGVFVSTPKVSAAEATVRIETSITNQSAAPREITVQTSLVAPDGKTVGAIESSQTAGNGAAAKIEQQIIFPKPQLWNLDDPKLYRAVTEVRDGGTILDSQTTTFGIRDAKFTSDTGFMLNGKKVVLYGVCLHEDGGAFGAAVPLAIWEQRLTQLRKLGANAIRTAHNPPAPEFLDLCDRMGFLVMDEFFDCWTVAKNPYDYHLFFNDWSKIDAADTVRRNRNHPSVILYSVGNEIHDTPKADIAIPILRGLVEVCHENDPTRAVTQALFRPNVSHDYDNGLADLLDVIGTNYRDNELLAAQRAKPERKIVGTEQRHDRQTWLWLRDNPSHSGQFLWTGVDYLGESQRWPLVNHSSGLVDRTGEIKPMAFERQSWWSAAPMVRLARRTAPNDRMPTDPGYGGPELHTQVQFADWTSRNSAPHDETVEAYSNCQEVELFLNGKSLGAKKINADASPRVWKVPFAPGTLKAVAKNGGMVAATDELRTAGKAEKIILTTDAKKLSPGWDSVARVRVTVVDAHGTTVPRADDLISFKISGPGLVAAVDNDDTISHEPFQASERHAFQGGCVAFVKASAPSGKITLSATAPGLASSSITIKASPELSR
jgi:beta-galactosidase